MFAICLQAKKFENKMTQNPYKIREKIYKHFYKQNKYQQFAGIFSFAKQLVEEKIMGNVYVQKRGEVYQYKFEIASIDGKRKFKNKSGFATKRKQKKQVLLHTMSI